VPCGNIFDDYPIVEPEATAAHGGEMAKKLLELIGFEVKESPDAALPKPAFEALGVVFDMPPCAIPPR
jgi:hypothetical protein